MMADTKPDSEVKDLRNQLDELRASDPTPQVEAAKQRAAETVSNAAADVSEAVAGPVRHGVERTQAAVASARRTAAQVNAQTESMSQSIRSQPLMALGLSLLAGYIIGRAVR